ncbi:MAG: rRNA cytosine-C5-methyltransferase [Muribaculaceae bacterium]|nr:rRNA cytosine-C5-methyltransferase [Muribaculaceae bacterium]
MELKKEFEDIITAMPGLEADDMLRAIRELPPVVSVRTNTGKGVAVPNGSDTVPWCPEGFYLPERRQFTFDPFFHGGRYYVQDASSMFIAHALRQLCGQPVRYLDLCAAPGGKTTAALSALSEDSLVVANEIVPQRARVLADNVMRWGSPNCIVTGNAPRDLGRLNGYFDVIAADVPCSGEGMFRKEPEAVAQWTPALVAECAGRQRSIVADVWPALRPGGLLIYSTCTFNRQENEEMILHMMETYGAEPLEIPTSPDWGIHAAIGADFPCYRFLPHLVRGEGLFLCALRKPEHSERTAFSPRKTKAPAEPTPKEVRRWLQSDFAFSAAGDSIIAAPTPLAPHIDYLRGQLRVLSAGVKVTEKKGKGFVPTHSLALAQGLNKEAFPAFEADYSTAIAYLRGEAINVSADRGYVLITHRGAPLGFVNNLGNRANNLYPKPLRIISNNTPATAPAVL